MNFNNYELSEVLPEYLESECYEIIDIMNKLCSDWWDYLTTDKHSTCSEIMEAIDLTELDLVERFANESGLICDEETLSARFDEQVMPYILEEHTKPGIAFTDQDMINQAFNDWSDSLCKDGEIHTLQYENYTYIGQWEEV